MSVPISENVSIKLSELHKYNILDTPPEQAFDDLVLIAAQICDVPISYISFIDEKREWIKSKIGVIENEIPIINSFSLKTILQPQEIFIIPDIQADKKYRNNSFLFSNGVIKFYAGVAIVVKGGVAIGALCVLDYRKRELTSKQISSLFALSRNISKMLEFRLCNNEPKVIDNTSRAHLIQQTDELEKRSVKPKESGEKYRTLVEQASDAIFITDSDFCFSEVNLSCSLISGYLKEELIGKSIYDLLIPEDVETIPLEINKLLAGETIISERRIRKKDGTIVPIELSSKILSDGRMQTIVRDITIRKNIEEKNKMLADAIKNVDEYITLTNENEEFVFVNDAFMKEYGYTESEIIGKNINIIRSGKNAPHKLAEIHQQAIENHWEGELWNIRKDGSEFLIYLSTSRIYDDMGKLIGLLGISRNITNLKNIEEKERKLNQRLVSVFESMTDGFISLDKEWKYTYVNKKAGEMFNREPASLVGKHIWTEFPEGIDQPFYKAYNKAVREKITVIFEDYYSSWDRWFENRVYPSDDGISIFFQDITERKKAEMAIQQSQEIFSKIFHNSPIPICFTTFEDGKFIEVNSSFLNITGYTKDEIMGKTSTEVGFYFKAEDRHLFIDKLKKEGSLWGFELPFRNRAGERRESLRYLSNIQYNNQNYVITFLIDITEQKKAEQLLRESEEKFSKIFHTSPIPISISTYEDGKFIDVNESFLRLTGYNREEVIGISSEKIGLFFDPLVRADLLVELMHKGRMWGLELPFKNKSGELRYSDRYIDIITLNGQQFLLVFIIDITDRKNSHLALLKSEEELRITNEQLHSLSAHLQNVREEERANLARDIHDELGQLLTAMKIDLGMLEQKLSAKQLGNSDYINDMKSLNGFIDETIKSVRKIISELRPEVLDQLGLIETIRWYVGEFKTRFKINCSFVTKLEDIKIDKTNSIAIFRIIQESLTNVVRHSNAKKVIIKLFVKNNKLILEIKDDGVGFDRNTLNSSKRFGLLGIRERILLMRGEFEINSSPGKGTNLIIRIPYFQKKKRSST